MQLRKPQLASILELDDLNKRFRSAVRYAPLPAWSTLYWRPDGMVTTPACFMLAMRKARPASFDCG